MICNVQRTAVFPAIRLETTGMGLMNCVAVQKLLQFYLDHSLEPVERATIEHHTASCGVCRVERARLERTYFRRERMDGQARLGGK